MLTRPTLALLFVAPLLTGCIAAGFEAATLPESSASANPAVAPGQVVWHDDFRAACAASADSGRPVLLFQMLGRLDQEFC